MRVVDDAGNRAPPVEMAGGKHTPSETASALARYILGTRRAFSGRALAVELTPNGRRNETWLFVLPSDPTCPCIPPDTGRELNCTPGRL